MPGIDEQPRVDQFARPEPCDLLGKVALSWIEPVVCRISLLTSASMPLSSCDRIVLVVGEDRKRRLGRLLLLLDLRQHRLPAA